MKRRLVRVRVLRRDTGIVALRFGTGWDRIWDLMVRTGEEAGFAGGTLPIHPDSHRFQMIRTQDCGTRQVSGGTTKWFER